MSPVHSIIAILAPAALTAAPVPQTGEVELFKDWAVGCDNGGTCQAISLWPDMGGPSHDEDGGPITIVRTAQDADHLKIRVLVTTDGIDRYRMTVDGELVDTGAVVDGDYPIEIVGTDALKVADAIIRGNELIVSGPDGEILTRISLAGSAAAIRYIDAQQNREATATALVAKGRKAFSPSHMPIPMIAVDQWTPSQRIPETNEIVKLIENSRCKDDRYGVVEDRAYPLGKRGDMYRALVLVSCGSGAYNFSSAPYIGEIIDGADQEWTFRPASFDRQPSWGGEGTEPLLVNAGWDDREQTLSSFGKGRGLGDCGRAENYVWDGERFRLINASAMDECRGAYLWITTWRAGYKRVERTAAKD